MPRRVRVGPRILRQDAEILKSENANGPPSFRLFAAACSARVQTRRPQPIRDQARRTHDEARTVWQHVGGQGIPLDFEVWLYLFKRVRIN